MTLEKLSQKLIVGEMEQVKLLTEKALDEGISPAEILNEGLIKGMDVVGEKFQAGEYFIPHMLIAARAMQAALEVLKPRLSAAGVDPVGKVILGTVKGDHHDIGKNLVKFMMEGKGFEVVDLGIDTSPEAFVAAVDESVDIVAMSALLSTTAPFIKESIDALVAAGVRDKVKVIVGGGVVNQQMADAFGADAYGQDAASGAARALALIKKGK